MTFSLLIGFSLVALLPALVWSFFWGRRVREREPACVLFQLFFFGVFAAIPLVMLREYFTSFPERNFFSVIPSVIVSIVVFAMLEEVVKAIAMIAGIEINRQWFDRLEDGFEYAASVALGFAFAENVMYFFFAYTSSGLSAAWWQTYALRSVVTMVSHVLFTGAFGLAYAYAYLRLPQKMRESPWRGLTRGVWDVVRAPIGVWRAFAMTMAGRVRGGLVVRSGAFIAAGFIVAVGLHTLFNVLMSASPRGHSLAALVLPLIVFLGWRYTALLRALPRLQGTPKKRARVKAAPQKN